MKGVPADTQMQDQQANLGGQQQQARLTPLILNHGHTVVLTIERDVTLRLRRDGARKLYGQ